MKWIKIIHRYCSNLFKFALANGGPSDFNKIYNKLIKNIYTGGFKIAVLYFEKSSKITLKATFKKRIYYSSGSVRAFIIIQTTFDVGDLLPSSQGSRIM